MEAVYAFLAAHPIAFAAVSALAAWFLRHRGIGESLPGSSSPATALSPKAHKVIEKAMTGIKEKQDQEAAAAELARVVKAVNQPPAPPAAP